MQKKEEEAERLHEAVVSHEVKSERSPAGRRPTVRRAGGKGRLVAEPNSAERQVAHENQLQVQMA